MANYNKSFNFRNGVQVDDDNLVVDTLGKVGIGTTVPLEFLDVRGNAVVSGFATAADVYSQNVKVSGIITASTLTDGKITISSGIITASSGVVTFYGDGRGIVNIPTSQWIDIDVGLGFTSIYNTGFVGVNTNDPRYAFQVAGTNDLSNFVSGVGINSRGDIVATGVITATTVRAALAATFLTGTIDNARIPSNISVSGIITASSGFVGSLTGTASTAQSLTGSPSIAVSNITAGIVTASSINSAGLVTATGVNLTGNAIIGGFISAASTITSGSATVTGNSSVSGILTAASINSGVSTVGISTVHQQFHVGNSGQFFAVTSDGKIGIGSATPTSDVLIRKSSANLVEVISDTGVARISIGQSVGVGRSTGVIRFGNSTGDLDIVNNNDGGDINYLLNGNGSSGAGKFSWQDGSTFAEIMSLNSNGNLSVVGVTTLASAGGITTTGGDLFVDGDISLTGNFTGTVNLASVISSNINVNSGISTFATINVTNLGVGTDSPISALDAQNATGLFAAIGIGTTTFYGSEVLNVVGSMMIPDGGVGIGTTYIDPAGASLQLYTPLIDLSEGHFNIKSDSSVGFNTVQPKAIFDFGNVGSATTRPVMVIPNITSVTRNGIGQTPVGSIIYNTSLNQFQGAVTGSGTTNWVDLGITTSIINSETVNVSGVSTFAGITTVTGSTLFTKQLNVSGVSTFNNTVRIGTGVTIQSGIVTATNGFLSGIGTAVQITTVGNQLVFTVPGVGTTSLTLF